MGPDADFPQPALGALGRGSRAREGRKSRQREFGARALRGLAPWAALQLVLFGTAVWLLTQPMEMRGTFL